MFSILLTDYHGPEIDKESIVLIYESNQLQRIQRGVVLSIKILEEGDLYDSKKTK